MTCIPKCKPSCPQSWTIGIKNFSPNHLLVYSNFDRNPKRTSLEKVTILVSNRDSLEVLKLMHRLVMNHPHENTACLQQEGIGRLSSNSA